MPRTAFCRKCQQPFEANDRGPLPWFCAGHTPKVMRRKIRRPCGELKRKLLPVYESKASGDPVNGERDYTPDEVEFMLAVEGWKKRTGRRFPANSDYLAIMKSLGYRKAEAPKKLPKNNEHDLKGSKKPVA